MDEQRIQRRIAGRTSACELFALLEPADRECPIFMESLLEEARRCCNLPAPPSPETRKVEPLARLGNTPIPFGKFAGKTFDDADLDYLDWLCREQESFYQSLRDYLRHPDLESRRRGYDK